MGRRGWWETAQALLLCMLACGRVGFDSPTARVEPQEDASHRDQTGDGGSAATDAAAVRTDASADNPCRLVENWDCPQEGNGDCIATCASDAGSYTLEVLSFTGDYFCAPPSQMTIISCEPTESENCAACLELAMMQCCFP